MLEFRTMSLPSVMLFVSMKISWRESSHSIVPSPRQIMGRARSFVMLTESFKGPLVKAYGQGSVPDWACLRRAGPGSGDLELGSFYGF